MQSIESLLREYHRETTRYNPNKKVIARLKRRIKRRRKQQASTSLLDKLRGG